MPTSVVLGQHFEEFIRRQIETGRFNNASEVMRAALRKLEDEEAKMAALRRDIQAGVQSGSAGSVDEVFDRLKKRIRSPKKG